MNTTVKKPVGVVGLGAMGMGVAMSLLREGFEVHACDVRAEAVQKVVDAGGIAAASPAALAPKVDVLITVVVNADQTEAVEPVLCRHCISRWPSQAMHGTAMELPIAL